MDEAKSSTSLKKHLNLIQADTKSLEESEISGTPLFTESVRQHGNNTSTLSEEVFTQYGLLGGDVSKLLANKDREDSLDDESDPRVFYNIKAPSSVFICGSQGSGKSHTLSCLLENCLIHTDANTLPRPLTGVVFHYDPFFSDARGECCEAASISSHAGVKVRVLCPPTNVGQITRLYKSLPNVEVQELRISQRDLNTKRMLDLMAVSSIQGGEMPLYMHVVTRILRTLRIKQQKTGGYFNYKAFRKALAAEDLNPGQLAPLEQRLEILESFMALEDVAESKIPGWGSHKPKSNKSVFDPNEFTSPTATTWEPKAGQLTIVDLSCPCVTPESACALFNICLNLFLEQPSTDIGRVIALDEAHKYMTESAESQTLTDSLLSTIRLQRHLGARIVIATQEPTISPKLLDLCTVTIVHRFTSPNWLESLQKHLAGAKPRLKNMATGEEESRSKAESMAELLNRIVSLRQGEALLFCPSGIVGVKTPKQTEGMKEIIDGFEKWSLDQDCSRTDPDRGSGLVHLGQGIIKIRIRERVTEDRGKSIMAG